MDIVPLMFRGLSLWFYDRAGFGVINKSETALINRFKVKSFPSLMVYQTHEGYVHLDSPVLTFFYGRISTQSVRGFIESYGLPEKKYITNKIKGFKPNVITELTKETVTNHFKRLEARRVVVIYTDNEKIPHDVVHFATMMK